MTARCDWCGQFVRSDAPSTVRFRNTLGDPVTKRLCPNCADCCRSLAAANVLRAPHEPYLRSMRDEFGCPS